MINRLLAERRRLCCALQYLSGEPYAAAVCRINRLDDVLEWIDAGRPKIRPEPHGPLRRITLEYAPHEALSLADALECVAKAIRQGAGQ